MKRVILDTGPLVAWLCPRDENHAWVRLAELHPGTAVCSTDGDFRFYRMNEHQAITLLAPFES